METEKYQNDMIEKDQFQKQLSEKEKIINFLESLKNEEENKKKELKEQISKKEKDINNKNRQVKICQNIGNFRVNQNSLICSASPYQINHNNNNQNQSQIQNQQFAK